MNSDLVCFLGRFQPWHNGHAKILAQALEISEHVLILCGSSNMHPNACNPWSFAQRLEYISACLPDSCKSKVCILPLIDYFYDQEYWLLEINKNIAKAKDILNLPKNCKVTWVGHHKDSDCEYLKQLPGDSYFEVSNYQNISATYIRSLLRDQNLSAIKAIVPKNMYLWLKQNSPNFPGLHLEKQPDISLVIICNELVMFLKDDYAYKLPSFNFDSNIDVTNMVHAYAYSWYAPEDVVWGDEYLLKKQASGENFMPESKIFTAYVREQIDDTALIWCDINRFKTIDFWYDHASIAHHVLVKIRENYV